MSAATILVPAPVLTSKKTDNPNDPNTIAKNAIYLLNQANNDKKFDPVPDKRVGESFRDLSTRSNISSTMFIINNPFPISLGTVGTLLVLAGLFL
jgi:hypothetical protein